MIKIIVNEQPLVLNDISVDFDLISPLTRSSNGSTVYNFEVPNDSEKINSKALGFPDRPMVYRESDDVLTTRIVVSGKTILQGEATVKFSNGSFNISIPFGNGLFYSEASEVSIRKLPICDITFASRELLATHLLQETQKSWPDAQYAAIPTQNKLFVPEEMEGRLYFENASIDEDETIEEGDVIETRYQQFEANAACVSFTLLSDNTGYIDLNNCDGTFLVGSNIYGDHNFVATITRVDGWFINNRVINAFEDGEFLAGSDDQQPFLTPYFYVAEVIHKIFDYFGYTIIDRFHTRNANFKSLLLLNLFNAAGGVHDYQNWPKYGIYSSNHLPDVTVTDFLKQLEIYRNIFCFINDTRKEVTILDLNDILNNTELLSLNSSLNITDLEQEDYSGFRYQMKSDSNIETEGYDNDENVIDLIESAVDTIYDLPDFPNYEEIRYVIEEDSWYKYAKNVSTGLIEWYNISNDFLQLNYFVLNGDDDRSCNITPVMFSGYYADLMLEYSIDNWIDIGMLLIFKTDVNPPAAGLLLSDSYLCTSSEFGIGEKVLLPEANWMSRRKTIQLSGSLSLNELNQLTLWRKYVYKGIVFIITKLEGQIQHSGKIMVDITAWTF